MDMLINICIYYVNLMYLNNCNIYIYIYIYIYILIMKIINNENYTILFID